ncbi:acyltransferase family protein [Corynebacterium aquilae]|uniref:acyltransferase family protein n=1 Tax=Corynebacterium aquilae TaxID=203263 RepID=UPI0009529845|nr:acyltransferase [Corynebacterium aquilae]
MSPSSYATRQQFLDSLEGLRAVAALGVMGTHIAFLTGIDQRTLIGALLARSDFFVAVFFSLSAFLLWRRHGVAGANLDLRRYTTRRIRRIVPAYLAVVLGTFLLVPAAYPTRGEVKAATVFFAQIYLPDGLAPALTHLWSMCVEVAFYLALPLLVAALRRIHSTRSRILIVCATAALSLGWAWLPFVNHFTPGGINGQIFPPAFFSWFAVGIIAAEAEPWATSSPRIVKVCGLRPLWWALALATMWLAAQEFFGPLGLVHPTAPEFARRTLAGGLVAAFIVTPYAFNPRSTALEHPTARWLGRISYCIFLIHLPVIETIMQLATIAPFTGHALTLTLVAVPTAIIAAWILYETVEKPFADRGITYLRQLGATNATNAATPLAATTQESPA